MRSLSQFRPSRQIGVLANKGGSTMGSNQDDMIVSPYNHRQKRLMGQSRFGMIIASATSAERVGKAMEQIDALLRQRHRIPAGGDGDFMTRSQEEIAQANQQQVPLMRTCSSASQSSRCSSAASAP
ncbi:MAG TPA: hypothetical protein VF701_10775 [Thermoanaerobaculia bacterium]